MIKNNICPLCGQEAASKPSEKRADDYTRITCDSCGVFEFHPTILEGYADKTGLSVRKRCILIRELLLKKPLFMSMYGYDYPHMFYYQEDNVPTEPCYTNVANLMKNYPKNVGEKIDRILVNLSFLFPRVGMAINFIDVSAELMFCETKKYSKLIAEGKCQSTLSSDYQEELEALESYFANLKYIESISGPIYRITAEGWMRIDELTKKHREINQGFIAMRFPNDRDTDAVKKDLAFISDGFKEAINACGYVPRLMLDIEHNNQIVPEIFFEIEQSKFTIVDVTYPNYGAYYEAGYAQALGKQVIICCRKGSENPHFDISQKNMIFWTDKLDLIDRLTKRIQATVGVNLQIQL